MLANLRYVFTISIFFMGISLSAQHIYWQKANNGKQVGSVKATNSSNKVHYFQLNHSRFQKELQNISLSKASSSLSRTIDFPHPEKGFISFTIAPYAIMEDALTQKFPEIQTFVGTNQNNKIYFSFSSKGLQATCINTQNNTVLFYQKEQKNTYAIYRKGDKAFLSEDLLNCSAPSITEKSASFGKKGHTDGVLRTFRLAISASGEYTSFHGGTKAEALAAIVATLTRVNALLEQELAVRLLLVGTNDRIIFTDAATDPYSGNLSGEVQTTIDTEIGNNNYDIGHLFHQTSERNDGNSGFLGSVCQTGKKGSAYVVHKTPVGDVFDIDYVLHEMGHQFGANHTWSYAEESSGVQVEPGSGSTIMGYAGISGSNNLQSHSDPYFHHSSLVQMQAFLNQTSCGQTIALSNNKPEIVSLKSYVVPPSTPFVLEATASDADGDLLTYSWEQIDDGVITNFNFGPTNILGANFRSIPPSTNSMRYFPRLAAIAAGGITQTNPTIDSAWETAASVSREFNFACTVRDNQSGGGQWVYETLKVQVDDSQPVFAINSQNSAETWLTGSVQSIQWAVGNTRNTPFNIEKVSIHLSTDGGNSFPIVLASNVPNTGSYPILVPAIAATSNARILIRAKNHIIFAINTADITIETDTIVLEVDPIYIAHCNTATYSSSFTFRSFNGFSEDCTFSTSGLPGSVGISFSPTNTALDNTTIDFELSNLNSLSVGVYPFQIVATASSKTKTVPVQLEIYTPSIVAPNLLQPENLATDVFISTTLEWESIPNTQAYTLELATDASFSTIIATKTLQRNTYTTEALAPNSTYYWRVKSKNACRESGYSTSRSFTTTAVNCLTNAGLGLPKSINASGTPTIETLVVFREDLPIVSVQPKLVLNHSFLGDLTIVLQSPAGKKVLLFNGICNDKQNINASFSNSGNAAACTGNPAVSGIVKPIGDLQRFIGDSTQGTWKLIVSDGSNLDGGTIIDFELEICAGGVFNPDADNDGFPDKDDTCPATPPNSKVDINGCILYKLPPEHFSIQTQAETCRQSNDGVLRIQSEQNMSYSLSLKNTNNGNIQTHSFNRNLELSDLSSGTYSVCISASDGTNNYERVCSTVVIEEPKELQAFFSVQNDKVVLHLTGSNTYHINWNGTTYPNQSATVTLPLQDGLNTAKITTDKACLGTLIKSVLHRSEPIVIHNNISKQIEVLLSSETNKFRRISVYDIAGNFLGYPEDEQIDNTHILINLAKLAKGIYLLKIEYEATTTIQKIIKP